MTVERYAPQVYGVLRMVFGFLFLCHGLQKVFGLVASGEMAAAYFMSHQTAGGWPIENNGELAVLYCVAFLYMVAQGAGPYSVDARFAPMITLPDRIRGATGSPVRPSIR